MSSETSYNMTRSTRNRTGDALRILADETALLGRFYVLVEKSQTVKYFGGQAHAKLILPVYQSSRRSLLIGLAGMLSTDQESITLEYLLDLAVNHPYDFEHASPDQLKAQTEAARSRLGVLGGVEEKLRAMRDRRLAHLDRKLINEPGSMQQLDISLAECDPILRAIEVIVDDFYAAYYGERWNFSAMKTSYADSIDAYFKRLEG